jgi:myo-inositol-1(or 4)-monophosphatase
MKNAALLELAIKSAIAAGNELIEHYDNNLRTETKESFRDIYSEADQAAEDCALKIIREYDPKVSILSEERGHTGELNSDDYWIVDALDGSVNYVHHIPLFCVSIAYISKGEATVSAIYVPLVDDLYYAAKGHGAFKNQQLIRTPEKSPADSLFAASFSGKSFDPSKRQIEFTTFGEVNDTTRGCLRTGSAALNLAYLAEGRFNGCWGKANKAWDIAGGLLIASESGAQVFSEPAGGNTSLLNYVAAPKENFHFLQRHTEKCF